MKIMTPCFPLLLLTLVAGVCASCSEEWDDDDPIKVKDITVIVKEDGTVKNATHFSVADGVDFYVDYVKYTLSNGELEVTGYNNKRLSGAVNIMSKLHYLDETYEVTAIGDGAFDNCDSITSVHIPNSVKAMGNYSFMYCDALTSVSIGDGVKRIGTSVFFYCENLSSIHIPEATEYIGNLAFYDCKSLFSFTIPRSVKEMGNDVFYDCYFASDHFINQSACTSPDNWGATLVDVETSDGLLIRNDTLVKCRLQADAVSIPQTVTTIGNEAFFKIRGITAMQIPNSVTDIENNAFKGCTSLDHLSIGNGVTRIGENAFMYCTSLTSVECRATQVPRTGEEPFKYCPWNVTLRVPAESLDLYRNAEYWKDFATIEALE